MKKETIASICKSIEAMEAQLASELNADAEVKDDVVSVEEGAETMLDEDDNVDEIDSIDIEQGDNDELPPADEEQAAPATVDEAQEVLNACASIEARIAEEENKDSEDGQVKEVLKAAQEVESKIASLEKEASQEKPGIEDEIGDEAHGGDASVSNIVDTKIDCDTDKEVFPTNSEYVAKITARLDRVASALEKRGMKRMAFRVDQLSDKLEASIRNK